MSHSSPESGAPASPYRPEPVANAVSAAVATLGEQAAGGVIVVCIGAGVSMAVPTKLPSGRMAAERLFDALAGSGYRDVIQGCPHDDLLCVADAMEQVTGGEDLIQQLLREVADFAEAEPNPAHMALALLILEGAVEGISLNWDCCVEHTPEAPDRIEVVTTTSDFLNVQGARIHKVHGCVRRGPKLLVSTRQIAEPPTWVMDELRGRLGGATIVFVGIGDVPSHVRVRINQLKEKMDVNHVYVADPHISEAWRDLLPELADARKITEPAEQFLDELLRAYVRVALRRFRDETTNPEQIGVYEARGIDMTLGAARLLAAIEQVDAESCVVFLRRGRFGWPPLEKVVQSIQVRKLLAAAAVLAARKPVRLEPGRLRLSFGEGDGRRYIEPLAAAGQASAKVVKAAIDRLKRQMASGNYAPGEQVIVICDGHMGPLALPTVPPSVIGPEDSAELVAEQADWLRAMSASEILEGKLPTGWEAA